MAKKKHFDSVLSNEISRRDFVNGTLVGFGAALLGPSLPAMASSKKTAGIFSDPWTGLGGVGDYGTSNGNVASVRVAAHLIRDGLTPQLMEQVEDTGEEYDMVIIGGGFSGIGAAYQFHNKYGNSKKCLIIENHPIFGGEAKQNEFEVDGYTLYGPQGSNDFGIPDKDDKGLIADIYRATGLPFEFKFVKQDSQKTKIKAPLENYYGVFWDEERFDTGYFLGSEAKNPWVINPRKDKLARLPWPDDVKADLNRAFEDLEDKYHGDNFDHWLDGMSYKDLLEKVYHYSPKVAEYFDPIIAISMGGVGCDVYSAYAAKRLEMPCTRARYIYDGTIDEQELGVFSYPGGNTGSFRHIVKYLIPESISGGKNFEDILYNPINFDVLDRPSNPISIRLNSTAIDISHEGPADSAKYVNISYHQKGVVRRIKAKTVVSAIGGWVAQHIMKDLPPTMSKAYQEFHHSPILVVNIALRNWRFLDKLGISSARWFEGFGNFFSMRRPMDTGEKNQPFDPDKPTVLTFYVPFNKPGHPIAAQGAMGRAELFSKSYRDYETEIVEQMTTMFAAYGFDAQRDIAGIVLNRWGHAYISPQPGFHFGTDGNPAPKEIIRKGYGRIQFGHSELDGYMSHTNALTEGSRAAVAAMQLL